MTQKPLLDGCDACGKTKMHHVEDRDWRRFTSLSGQKYVLCDEHNHWKNWVLVQLFESPGTWPFFLMYLEIRDAYRKLRDRIR